jgi:hypothetical protein
VICTRDIQWQSSGPQGDRDELRLTGLSDLLAEPDDAIEWIIEDRFSYGSVNLLAGKPKAGKSTLARYLAFCVATGTPFLGYQTISGPVWYIVLEDKRSEVRRHFRNLGATGIEAIRFLFGNQPELLEKLTLLAERERPLVVVVDTLQRFIDAKDLNDYAEVTAKLTPIIALARSTRCGTCARAPRWQSRARRYRYGSGEHGLGRLRRQHLHREQDGPLPAAVVRPAYRNRPSRNRADSRHGWSVSRPARAGTRPMSSTSKQPCSASSRTLMAQSRKPNGWRRAKAAVN